MRRSQSSDAASNRNRLEDRVDACDKTTMWRLGFRFGVKRMATQRPVVHLPLKPH